MSKRYLNRLESIDRLIRTKATGSPQQLADRLQISVSLLYTLIVTMKERGAPIKYNKSRCSYYYEGEGGFDFCFRHKEQYEGA
jgi:predicted DNA-binding transcriptional regulator YafY